MKYTGFSILTEQTIYSDNEIIQTIESEEDLKKGTWKAWKIVTPMLKDYERKMVETFQYLSCLLADGEFDMNENLYDMSYEVYHNHIHKQLEKDPDCRIIEKDVQKTVDQFQEYLMKGQYVVELRMDTWRCYVIENYGFSEESRDLLTTILTDMKLNSKFNLITLFEVERRALSCIVNVNGEMESMCKKDMNQLAHTIFQNVNRTFLFRGLQQSGHAILMSNPNEIGSEFRA